MRPHAHATSSVSTRSFCVSTSGVSRSPRCESSVSIRCASSAEPKKRVKARSPKESWTVSKVTIASIASGAIVLWIAPNAHCSPVAPDIAGMAAVSMKPTCGNVAHTARTTASARRSSSVSE